MESYEVFQLDVALAGNVEKNDSWALVLFSLLLFLMSRVCARATE